MKPSKTIWTVRRDKFLASLAAHGIKPHGISWLSLQVILLSSDNRYIRAGTRGVLRLCEHQNDMTIGATVAVFHEIKDDGSLGPPVECKNPIFVYQGSVL